MSGRPTSSVTHMDIGVTTSGDFVTLEATQTDGSKVTLLIPPHGIEKTVVGLLRGAAASADLSKATLLPAAATPNPAIYATARGVTAHDLSNRNDAFALNFLFGQTGLAIALSKKPSPATRVSPSRCECGFEQAAITLSFKG